LSVTGPKALNGEQAAYQDVVPFARKVVEEVLVPGAEWTLGEAQSVKPDAVLGDLVETEEMDGEIGRIVAAQARQTLQARLVQIQRDQVMRSFAERQGEILTGVVMRVDRRNLVLDVGRAEAYLPSTELSPLDTFRIGENVKSDMNFLKPLPVLQLPGAEIIPLNTRR